MQRLLVLFTGAGSAGKTTLLKELQKEYSNSDALFLSETIRNLYKQNIIKNIDTKATSYDQLLITATQQNLLWAAINSSKTLIVSERSPICTLAYARTQADCDDYVKKINEDFLHNVINNPFVKVLVLYFPNILEFEEDGVRVKESAKRIDNEILHILDEFHIFHVKLLVTDLNQRKNTVTSLIEIYSGKN